MMRLFFSASSTASRTRELLGAIAAVFCFTLEAAGAGAETRMEVDYLRVAPVPWLTESSLAPHGDERTATVLDTLDAGRWLAS
jgi:hypothetical protein